VTDAVLNTVTAWIETTVAGVTPLIRTSDRFVLSKEAGPLEQVPKLGATRTFEVVTGDRSPSDRCFTHAVEWNCDVELRIGYMGDHSNRDLHRLRDSDIEQIDRTIVNAIITGAHPVALNDVKFEGVPAWVDTLEGANHKVAKRALRARYKVPALGS
jgi:hypothetical protein